MNIVILLRKTKFLSFIILFICLVQSTQSSWPFKKKHKKTTQYILPPNTPDDDDGPLDVLRCVCDIRNASFEDLTINQLPELCTAAATSQNSEGDVKNMGNIKTTDIPFIQYFNEYTYELWNDHLSDDQNMTAYMKDHRLDGIIFDHLFKDVDYGNNEFDAAQNQAIHTFFQNLKKANPDGLFGLALPKCAERLPKEVCPVGVLAFDYGLLDEVVDFYVIQTIDYRPCVYAHVFKMEKTCSIDDMRDSLNALRQSIDLKKVLLTIQVYSIGVTSDTDEKNPPVLISYSEMCHYKGNELSDDLKYCKDSLNSLYKKGQLVVEFGMLGAYVQFIDYDDFAGSCGCANANGDEKFPATAAILTGMDPNAPEPESCGDFGDYDDTSADDSADTDD